MQILVSIGTVGASPQIGEIFALRRGRFPANIRINFTSEETRVIVLPTLKNA